MDNNNRDIHDEKDKLKIKEFVSSKDYRDIVYMVDHIKNHETLCSCLEDLGYKIGIDIILKRDRPIKDIQVFKGKEIRMIIAYNGKKIGISVIVDIEKTKRNK